MISGLLIFFPLIFSLSIFFLAFLSLPYFYFVHFHFPHLSSFEERKIMYQVNVSKLQDRKEDIFTFRRK